MAMRPEGRGRIAWPLESIPIRRPHGGHRAWIGLAVFIVGVLVSRVLIFG